MMPNVWPYHSVTISASDCWNVINSTYSLNYLFTFPSSSTAKVPLKRHISLISTYSSLISSHLPHFELWIYELKNCCFRLFLEHSMDPRYSSEVSFFSRAMISLREMGPNNAFPEYHIKNLIIVVLHDSDPDLEETWLPNVNNIQFFEVDKKLVT